MQRGDRDRPSKSVRRPRRGRAILGRPSVFSASLAAATAVIVFLAVFSHAARQEAEATARALGDLRALLNAAGCSLDCATHEIAYGLYTIKPATDEQLVRTALWLRTELRLYGVDCLPRFGLRQMSLCSGLEVEGEQRGFHVAYESERMLISTDVVESNELFATRALHHELSHIMEGRMGRGRYEDPEWNATNVHGMEYGEGGHLDRDPWHSIYDIRLRGVLTEYSRASNAEDKAEVFATMMTRPLYLKLRCMIDGVLRDKVALTERRWREFCPEFSESFWGTIHDRRVQMRDELGLPRLSHKLELPRLSRE